MHQNLKFDSYKIFLAFRVLHFNYVLMEQCNNIIFETKAVHKSETFFSRKIKIESIGSFLLGERWVIKSTLYFFFPFCFSLSINFNSCQDLYCLIRWHWPPNACISMSCTGRQKENDAIFCDIILDFHIFFFSFFQQLRFVCIRVLIERLESWPLTWQVGYTNYSTVNFKIRRQIHT